MAWGIISLTYNLKESFHWR